MNILGISCFYHDSAACLIKDGKVIAAAQEERFTRKKHDENFPKNAVEYCLKEGNITIDEIDYVGFYDKPFVKFERILETTLSAAPKGFPPYLKAVPVWLSKKLWIPNILRKELNYKGPIVYTDHHEAHAAGSFLVSPYDEAIILTLDGVGEWATATAGVGKGNQFKLTKEIRFPHSLGLLYSAFTYFLGFKVNSAEYKVMGLAPYGEPKYYDLICKNLIDIKEDGSFRLNMDYFGYTYSLRMTNDKFSDLLGVPPRKPESKLDQVHKDIARSVQKVTEEIVLRMVRHLHKETGIPNLCLSGGVALNCVANGKILRETPIKNIFIQPAAGDAGSAMGVAAFVYYSYLNNPRNGGLAHSYFGPEFSDAEIESYLKQQNIPYEKLSRDDLLKTTAQVLTEENVIGWFQGRMEFGPRALGNRSIIADPRGKDMQSKVNLKIKFRESFRPFAPAVLEEKAKDYFQLEVESPYMLLVAPVHEEKRSLLPSITHVDGSARVQTVRQNQNPIFYDLIKEFEKLTGVSVLINTSFNVRGEPIVCSPEDAYRCFMRTHMDYLVLGSFFLDKKKQPALKESVDWQKEFELD